MRMKTWRSCGALTRPSTRGDIEPSPRLFDESAVWHLPGRSSMANDYQGRDAILAYFGQIAQETGGPSSRTGAPAADDDDRVIGIQRSTADATAAPGRGN